MQTIKGQVIPDKKNSVGISGVARVARVAQEEVKSKIISRKEVVEEKECIEEKLEFDLIEDEEMAIENENGIRSIDKDTDPGSSVVAEFRHGFPVKIVVEYLRMTNWQGTFIFREDEIIYKQMNSKGTVLNSLTIDTHELSRYRLQSETGEVVMRVNLADLRQRTRGILKKDKVVISKMPYDTNMYLAIYSQNSSSMSDHPHHHIIPTLKPEYSVYGIPTYTRSKKKPNCAVDQGDFAKICSSFASVKCSYVIVQGFEKGVLFRGMSQSHEQLNIKEFGQCFPTAVENENVSSLPMMENSMMKIRRPKEKIAKIIMTDPGEIDTIRISIDIIKAFSKLNGLSNSGNIKMIVEKDKPFYINCKVGPFAELDVFVRSPPEENQLY